MYTVGKSKSFSIVKLLRRVEKIIFLFRNICSRRFIMLVTPKLGSIISVIKITKETLDRTSYASFEILVPVSYSCDLNVFFCIIVISCIISEQ